MEDTFLCWGGTAQPWRDRLRGEPHNPVRERRLGAFRSCRPCPRKSASASDWRVRCTAGHERRCAHHTLYSNRVHEGSAVGGVRSPSPPRSLPKEGAKQAVLRKGIGLGGPVHVPLWAPDAMKRARGEPWPRYGLVPEEGVEPSRPCGHGILSPARLPVPPLRRREKAKGTVPYFCTRGRPRPSGCSRRRAIPGGGDCRHRRREVNTSRRRKLGRSIVYINNRWQ